MWICEQIGFAYRMVKYHELAIDHFKIQMSLAWELNDKVTELRAYDNLSIEFYYNGDIESSKLYKDRCIKGQIEKFDSVARTANNFINEF